MTFVDFVDRNLFFRVKKAKLNTLIVFNLIIVHGYHARKKSHISIIDLKSKSLVMEKFS